MGTRRTHAVDPPVFATVRNDGIITYGAGLRDDGGPEYHGGNYAARDVQLPRADCCGRRSER